MNKIKKAFSYFFLSLRTLIFFLNKNNNNSNTVLIISNGMSMSGAPLVLQDVVEYFKNNGYTPILLYEHDGKLRKKTDCTTKCCFFFEKTIQRLALKNKYDYIFVNTIASHKWINYLEENKIKYNLWMHEGDEYFSIYNNFIPKELKYAKVFYVSDITLNCINKYSIKCNKVFLPYKYQPSNSIIPFNDDNKTVLLVGSICKRKNQLDMLKAIEILETKGVHDVEYLFVGTPIEKEYGKKFYLLSQKHNTVKVIDYLPHDKIMTLYNNVYLCVCTSTDDPLPVTITEAIFKKRLVLVSSGTGHYKMIKDNKLGLFYTTNNTSELAEQIMYALKLSADEYNKNTDNAYNYFESFFSIEYFFNVLDRELI